VNDDPLLGTPVTVTVTLPVVAPVGTGTAIDVAPQLVGVAAVPLKFTVLVPWVDPKFVPIIVTGTPILPEIGDRLVIAGVGNTVKLEPLLANPLTVTTTLPEVPLAGTDATIEVGLQLDAAAPVPLNVTVLVAWVVPKFVPAIVTGIPKAPEVGDKLVMPGADATVKLEPLLSTPLA